MRLFCRANFLLHLGKWQVYLPSVCMRWWLFSVLLEENFLLHMRHRYLVVDVCVFRCWLRVFFWANFLLHPVIVQGNVFSF